MSKQRSWDAFRDPCSGYVKRGPRRGYTQPGRFVEWPEGAPPQEDVPHAGTRVAVRDDGAGLTYKATVCTGPFMSRGKWMIVVCDDDGACFMEMLSSIRPVPEKRTATGEVVGNLCVSGGYKGISTPDGYMASTLPAGTYTIIREDA